MMLISTFSIVYANKQLEDLKDKVKESEKLEQEKAEEVGNIKSEVNKVSNDIDKLDNQIQSSTEALLKVEKELQELAEAIEINNKKLHEARNNLDEKQEMLTKRLRVSYMRGNVSNLEVILGSNSVEDLLMRYDILERVANQDKNLIDFTNRQIKVIDETEKLLAQQLIEQKQKKAELEERKSQLEAATAEKKSYMDNLVTDLKLAEAEYDKFVEQTKSINAQITKLEAELEAKRKAEEERRKRAQEAKNQQYQGKLGNGELLWPLPGYNRITSYYGLRNHPIFKVPKFHSGIDIGAPSGTPIVAAEEGIVISASRKGGYGYCIMVSHGDGVVTLYAHCSGFNASVGQYVNRGQTIAYVGNSGYSTGPHLHFEVRINGNTTDPLGWL
ncbi:MAG: peptidoglycan DD-metalloendopeptidase family protein [Tissierellia bacterium]|nr:peptidoglycan DD-metalloendopeptidase family protein [Tissierellia bacterium]